MQFDFNPVHCEVDFSEGVFSCQIIFNQLFTLTTLGTIIQAIPSIYAIWQCARERYSTGRNGDPTKALCITTLLLAGLNYKFSFYHDGDKFSYASWLSCAATSFVLAAWTRSYADNTIEQHQRYRKKH